MSGKDKLISVEHLKWNVGGIKCGTLSVEYLNWILDHEEPAVDAIPIEFIRGEIARMNQGANRYLSECATYAEDLENLIIEWERWKNE